MRLLIGALLLAACSDRDQHFNYHLQRLRDFRMDPQTDYYMAFNLSSVCKDAAAEQSRSRVARELVRECNPDPLVRYYDFWLPRFPTVRLNRMEAIGERELAETCSWARLDWRVVPAAHAVRAACERSGINPGYDAGD
jgi:hypothetical protein